MASTTLIPKFAPLEIPLEDVVKATNNFHRDNIISEGTFGPAYKGRLLRSGKLMKIAARRLDRKRGLGDTEFWTEVSVLSELKHTNLVSIVGFCDDKGEKIIITTYEANGSLEQYLNSPELTWVQRLRISIGVGRALSYLHYKEGRDYGIIHRNVNSSTILLDENWDAKLSCFEISIKQLVNRMDQVVLSEPIGAIGYVDPAIEKTGGVTHKSDIYSFGVVLFEILYGRKAYVKNEATRLLDRLVKYHKENETLVKDVVHPNLWNQMILESVIKYSEVAYSCFKEEIASRPNMDDIVAELEKVLELQLPHEILRKNLEHLKIPLRYILLATDDFSDKYRLKDTPVCTFYITRFHNYDIESSSSMEGKNIDEVPVVIKRILPEHGREGEEEFFTEVEMLTSVKHRNIVTLLGFCVEGSEKILVLEHLSKGNLHDHLKEVSSMRILTWEKRLKICIDVANALNYLHYEMEGQKVIINRDINSYNIWLDENWRAKIFEFGMSIYLPPNQLDEALYLKRLLSREKVYADPEYVLSRKLKRESDVYSIGVLLFEILCGRLASDLVYLKESEEGLAFVAKRCFREGTLEEIIDPVIKEETSENSFILDHKHSLHTFFKIAYQCVAKIQDERPTMKVVIKELEKALSFLEDPVSDIDQLVNELEKTSETHLAHKNIPEEQIEHPNTEQQPDTKSMLDEHQLKKLVQMRFRLTDIKLATDGFSDTYAILWTPYHTLYRAELKIPQSVKGKNKGKHPKRPVVIKRFLPRDDDCKDALFSTSVGMLFSVKHPNIATFLGGCIEGSETIIVTESFYNGYLGQYLGNIKKRHTLTWEKRLKICIDVAQALNYLHYEMEDQKVIINNDIKSRNIGLDENWEAKIVEFEISVFLPQNQEDEAFYPGMIFGNEYYIDPEYEKSGKLKRESDVYSFGVVMFEILCGKLAFDPIYKKEKLAPVARRSFCMRTINEMIDPVIKEETEENSFALNRGPNKDSLHTFLEIAYQCTAETQDQRPTMKVVLKELEKALCFQKNKDNPRISLEDIKGATNNFHANNFVGGGGFGGVYKGNLKDGDGFKTIVAKRLDTRLGQGEQQFLSELQILWEYKHENIICLVGYCDEKDEKIIVYEYAPRGSLDRYLNYASLTWMQRLHICVDVASALDFIHGGVGKQAKVIHRDIKTANILLSDDWKAKLADFGLSLISPINQETDYVIDHVCGTPGYLDPLYRKSGFLTVESDIYSFGVVLFEILCGRSTFAVHKHEGHYLPDFIKNIFEKGKQDEVVFDKIREQIVPESLTAFQVIAYRCLHHEREKRPTTEEVLMQLQMALAFQISKGE